MWWKLTSLLKFVEFLCVPDRFANSIKD